MPKHALVRNFMGDPPNKKHGSSRPAVRVHASSCGLVTTNAFEIADFAAMHKQKLRVVQIQRQSVSFAQQPRRTCLALPIARRTAKEQRILPFRSSPNP
jgi:hypothetical protein